MAVSQMELVLLLDFLNSSLLKIKPKFVVFSIVTRCQVLVDSPGTFLTLAPVHIVSDGIFGPNQIQG